MHSDDMKECPVDGYGDEPPYPDAHSVAHKRMSQFDLDAALNVYTQARLDFARENPVSRDHERLEVALAAVHAHARREAFGEVRHLLHLTTGGDTAHKVSNAYWTAYNHVNKELSK